MNGDEVTIPAAVTGVLTVKAAVNGSSNPATFTGLAYLDTGSMFSVVVSQETADALNLRHGDPVGVGTATGSGSGYRTSVYLAINGLAPVFVSDAVVIPEHHDFPLIGLPVLKQLAGSMTINWQAPSVQFDPTPEAQTLPAPPDAFRVVFDQLTAAWNHAGGNDQTMIHETADHLREIAISLGLGSWQYDFTVGYNRLRLLDGSIL